jgi:FKBP-type peptidyl-prolyl cis-trans isomerase
MRVLIASAVAAAALAVAVAGCGGGDSAEPTVRPSPTRISLSITVTSGATPTADARPTEAGSGAIVLENPTTTASGLQYVDTVVGAGAQPGPTSQVTVHYTGKLAANGRVFDSSVERGQPASFRMNGVIPGFSEGLSTMKVGGKRTIYIPAALGYGAAGYPPVIPPNADLVFEVELLAVR